MVDSLFWIPHHVLNLYLVVVCTHFSAIEWNHCCDEKGAASKCLLHLPTTDPDSFPNAAVLSKGSLTCVRMVDR